MDKKRLEIVGISNSQTQSGAYALVLSEVEGSRRLPIIIGGFEAQSIAIELEGMKPNRPLTHDLLKNMMDTYRIQLKEVVINKFAEGVFFALLICDNHGEIIEMDARTSDAVALAVRFQCDIFTYEPVLAAAGIEMSTLDEQEEDDKPQQSSETQTKDEMEEYSMQELEEMLQSAIEQEDYEKASKLRDLINSRKSSGKL